MIAEARVTLDSQFRWFQYHEERANDWKWFREQIIDATKDTTRSLYLDHVSDTLTLGLTHASAKPTTRRSYYLRPWHPSDYASELATLREQVPAGNVCLLHGHTHMPVHVVVVSGDRVAFRPIKYGQPEPLGEGCIAINPGSVGQPRDGDPRAAFAIIDTDAQTVEFRRVEYDRQAVISELYEDSNSWQVPGVLNTLTQRLLTANGGMEGQMYHTIYHAPAWDLDVDPDHRT
jgi:diadenosine tetraphosphatase ApaH/serine/threonine PP2A family protein phosphatase